MKRPAFQFYPADWRKDVELRSCSIAARGLWIDMLCIAHECEPYGHLTVNGKPMTAGQIAGQVGLTKQQCSALIQELADNGVARMADEGAIYSKRMVDDERLRNVRAEAGRLGGNPALLGGKLKQEVNHTPTPSSSSSSSPSGEETSNLPVATARPPSEPLALVAKEAKTPPDCPHQDILALWAEVLPAFPQHKPAMWRGSRADHLRARWRETAVERKWEGADEGVAFFRKLFGYVGRSSFLSGKSKTTDGRPPFQCELAWLVEPLNWAKVIEGKYHPEAA